jgi:hypothetical protein
VNISSARLAPAFAVWGGGLSMRNHDVYFDRPIYPYIFAKMQEYGRQLESLGYKESRGKPNLFYCSYPSITFMADLRGTKFLPIFKDPRPFVYVSNKDASEWEHADVARTIEIARLKSAGLPLRAYDDDPGLSGKSNFF